MNLLDDCLIGSDPDSLAAWHSAYYAMVERYLMDGRFLGKEQSVMASTCLQSPGLCLLVRGDGSHWFALQEWLRAERDLGKLIHVEDMI